MTDGYDYTSPIRQAVSETIKRMEDTLMIEVTQTVGYDIDRDELIKALQYDRAQYDKGFADGMRAAERHGYWRAGRICSVCNTDVLYEYGIAYPPCCPYCGARMDLKDGDAK